MKPFGCSLRYSFDFYPFIFIYTSISLQDYCILTKQKRRVFPMNLREIFIRAKVQHTLAPFSCLKCLSFFVFLSFLIQKILHSGIFFAWEGTKKRETHAQCVRLSIHDEISNIELSYLHYYVWKYKLTEKKNLLICYYFF